MKIERRRRRRRKWLVNVYVFVMNFNELCNPVELARVVSMHPGQTEDNEQRFLIESPVLCSGINSNYATWESAYEFRIHAVFSKSPLSPKARRSI